MYCSSVSLCVTICKGSTFAKMTREKGLLKTLGRCCLVNELSLHHTRWVLTTKYMPKWSVLCVLCFDSTYSGFSLLDELFRSNVTHILLQFTFKEDIKCNAVCTKSYKKGDKEDAAKLDFLKMGMQLNYQHHWLVIHVLFHTVVHYLLIVEGWTLCLKDAMQK